MPYYGEKKMWASVIEAAYEDAMRWLSVKMHHPELPLGAQRYEAFSAFQLFFDPKHNCSGIPILDIMNWLEVDLWAVRDRMRRNVRDKLGRLGLIHLDKAISAIKLKSNALEGIK